MFIARAGFFHSPRTLPPRKADMLRELSRFSGGMPSPCPWCVGFRVAHDPSVELPNQMRPLWRPSPIMKKILLALLFLTASVFATARLRRVAEGPDRDFRCNLAAIRCDACRNEIAAELKHESGVRAVRFEGQDRKDLVVTHAPSRSEESLRQSLKRLGYSLDTPAGNPAKPVSTENCACPVERAKSGYLK